jgi:hypothetical protein
VFPKAGTYVGMAGIPDYLRTFLEAWDRVTIAAEELIDAGDRVIVSVNQQGIGKGSGPRWTSATSTSGHFGRERPSASRWSEIAIRRSGDLILQIPNGANNGHARGGAKVRVPLSWCG